MTNVNLLLHYSVSLYRKKLLMCPNSGEEFSVTTDEHDALSVIEVELYSMICPVRLSSLSNLFATNTLGG